jgi:hypothetical protein
VCTGTGGNGSREREQDKQSFHGSPPACLR